MVCAGTKTGSGPGGRGYGDRPVCFRHRDRPLRRKEVSSGKGRVPGETGKVELCERDCRIFHPYLCPAVGDESGHPDGPGAGQQLWAHGHGGFCGCSEDRRVCLYAGAGFRQRVFHVYCPELRGEKGRPDPPGA